MNPDLFDPVLLSRIQFAFTVSFHIIFPAFTIGLASWLAVVEWRWLRTGDTLYADIYRMWVKIFAVAFGMGVVSGVVMSYQFGTNWSVFSDTVGNVLGPILGYEVLTAFFLEASFLGIMLFGWDRVSSKMHFTSTIIVAIGTLISAFWILSANSWMQTPQGYEVGENGILYPTNWFEVVLNPSFIYRFLHMVTAAYLTTAFVVTGIAAYYLWKQRFVTHAKIMLAMGLLLAVFLAPVQLVIGDFHGLNTLEYQPEKIAAMEGIWETEQGAGFRLFAIPDSAQATNHYEVIIPKLSSLILTHSLDGTVRGLRDWPPEDRPPVGTVFTSFRIMVAIGLLMILTGLFTIILFFRKRLFSTKWFQLWCMALTPAGFIAILAGWVTTEVGRQPYAVYGILRTSEAVSPVMGEKVGLSLLVFIITYLFVFGAGSFYQLKLIGKGPAIKDEPEEYYDHSVECTFAKAILKHSSKAKENSHV